MLKSVLENNKIQTYKLRTVNIIRFNSTLGFTFSFKSASSVRLSLGVLIKTDDRPECDPVPGVIHV